MILKFMVGKGKKLLLFFRKQWLQLLAFDEFWFQNFCSRFAFSPPGCYACRVNCTEFPCFCLLHSPIHRSLFKGDLVSCFASQLPFVVHDMEVGFHRILLAREMLAQ